MSNQPPNPIESFIFSNLLPLNPSHRDKVLAYTRGRSIFGIGTDSKTVAELAEQFEVSGTRVRQLEESLRDKILERIGVIQDVLYNSDIGQSMSVQIESEGRTDSLDILLKDANTRIRNCLTRAGIKTVHELLQCTPKDLLKLPTFGGSTLEELETLLLDRGLFLASPTKPAVMNYAKG